jgi:hypothetical protein
MKSFGIPYFDAIKIEWRSFFILCAALCVAAIVIKKNGHAKKKLLPARIFTIDPLFSSAEQEVITSFLRAASVAPQELFKKILDQFSVIKSVSTSHQATGVNEITITAKVPVVCINDSMLMTDEGLFVPRGVYEEDFLKNLSTLQVGSAKNYMNADQALISFAKKVPSYIWQRFMVTWKDSTAITLHDKIKTDFCVLCNSWQAVEPSLLERVDQVYDVVREMKPSKKMEMLIADIRFENQIVAYYQNDRGG